MRPTNQDHKVTATSSVTMAQDGGPREAIGKQTDTVSPPRLEAAVGKAKKSAPETKFYITF